jgi:hypothetical protein
VCAHFLYVVITKLDLICILDQLIKEGYSTGLALALSENAARYDFRYWLVDNSGSMQIGDGHRIVWKEGKAKPVSCTRWEEITQTVTYHARLASILECPTIFRVRICICIVCIDPIACSETSNFSSNSRFQASQ